MKFIFLFLADHVLLRLSDFADDPPIFITVRTRTREGTVSSDSNVARVPRGISVNTALGTVTQSAPIAVSSYSTQMNDPAYGAFAVSRSLGAGTSCGLLQPAQTALSTQIPTLGHTEYQLAGLPSSAPTANLLSGLQLGATQGNYISNLLFNYLLKFKSAVRTGSRCV